MKTLVTAKTVRTLPKGRYSVGGGLCLLVSSETSRTWIFRYQIDGKRRDMSLGSANSITLTAAKTLADRARTMVADGKDPIEERRAPKREASAHLFRDVASEAIELFQAVRKWRNAKHAAQWTSTIETYAVPVIGRIDVKDVTREDILLILKPIWETKTETADRLRGRLDNIFDYAISKGYCTNNPARWKANLESFLPAASKIKPESHHAAMPLDELKEFVSKLDTKHVSHAAILFGILTASRAQEFLGMTWDEVDIDNATWSLDMKRTKTLVPHRVPLSKQAIAILKERERTSEFVFPSPYTGRAMSVDTPRTMLRKVSGTDYTMHGFRSSFRDWGEENLIHDTLLEKALSHSQKTKTVRAYQRSDLLEQRRPVMQMWADEILPQK